jgi:hypothetical protein
MWEPRDDGGSAHVTANPRRRRRRRAGVALVAAEETATDAVGRRISYQWRPAGRHNDVGAPHSAHARTRENCHRTTRGRSDGRDRSQRKEIKSTSPSGTHSCVYRQARTGTKTTSARAHAPGLPRHRKRHHLRILITGATVQTNPPSTWLQTCRNQQDTLTPRDPLSFLRL